MSGDPQFVILKWSAWMPAEEFEDAILGAVVKDFLKPSNLFLPRKETPVKYVEATELKPIKKGFNDFVLSSTSSGENSADAQLHNLTGLSLKGTFENKINLSGKLIRYKRLQQVPDFFEELKKDPEVAGRVPGWIKLNAKWPVCLVMGIIMVEDVDISWEGAKERRVDGNVQLPIGEIMQAGGVPNPGGQGDVKLSAVSERKVGTLFRAKSGEASIFGLELLEVTKGLFKRQKLVLKETPPSVEAGRALDKGDDRQEGDEDLRVDPIDWTPELLQRLD